MAMQYNSFLQAVPLGVGMLILLAGASGCAVEAEDICAEDDPECLDPSAGFDDEATESAEQDWRRGGRGLRPDLWGRRFYGGGHPWVIGRGGFRHRIADRGVYGGLWGLNDWDNLGYWDGLGGIPIGAGFGGGAFLGGVGCGGCGDIGWGGCGSLVDVDIGCGGDYLGCGDDWWGGGCGGGMYLVNSGFRHTVTRETFSGFGFGMGGVRGFGYGGLNNYPLGGWNW